LLTARAVMDVVVLLGVVVEREVGEGRRLAVSSIAVVSPALDDRQVTGGDQR
jgi:hypothetical protein